MAVELFWALQHLPLVLNKELRPSLFPYGLNPVAIQRFSWSTDASLELHLTSSQDFGFGVIQPCTSPPPPPRPLLLLIELHSAPM
ncbi:hypothetical protein K443DRAFT_6014 [Laccaria amethystina LaAM-08-1]|uniref:Uncharacterized protein n=1 Tax=Laccaria amethystina LaAM-08-1 TaxID=1095629 RepID=A0A0C9WU16_9AGAR|nr:hypothetical protein K443DRAFT_6014 [Laccaria amethystina LaAM-08-1]